MDVYILDSLRRRIQIVDWYESLIWTERQAAWGDIDLRVISSRENRKLFVPGTQLAIPDSYRVMELETVERTTDTDGRDLLKLTGRSMEKILDDRLARGTKDNLTTTPKWVITGKPVDLAKKIFHDVCVTGILNVGDKIPSINEGSSIFPPDTVAAPTDTVVYEIEPKTVYAAVKEMCDLYNLGFRLFKNLDTGQLWFDIYTGSDRTTHQTTLPAVVFGAEFDNLKSTTEITTNALYKNVAYVLSPVGYQEVYALDVDPTTAGFERHALIVRADDITDTDPATATAKMIQRGKQELAKCRKVSAFDGEISQSSQYKYGRDYFLGDLVELRNDDGVSSTMQVTEQIFVSDKEGERSYPTLSVTQFVNPGSWLARPAAQTWSAVSLSERWMDA